MDRQFTFWVREDLVPWVRWFCMRHYSADAGPVMNRRELGGKVLMLIDFCGHNDDLRSAAMIGHAIGVREENKTLFEGFGDKTLPI